MAALRAAREAGHAPLSRDETETIVRYFRERSRACIEATKGGFLRGFSAKDALIIALGEIWTRGEMSAITALHSKGELVNSLRRACIEQGIGFPTLLAFALGLAALLSPWLDAVLA